MREKIDAILEAGEMFLNAPDDLAEFIDKPAVKRSRTDQILALICEEIGKVENSYPETVQFADPRYAHIVKVTHDAFEGCRRDILAMLQGKEAP